MRISVDKTQEDKSQAIANVIAEKKHSRSSVFPFADNRPEVVRQRKIQEWATGISQNATTTAVNNLSPIQRFTDLNRVVFKNHGDWNFKKRKWKYLKSFRNIQLFLSNISRTKPHLDQLNVLMDRNRNLPALLTMLMSKWSRKVPILVNPVPRELFIEETVGGLGKPRLFEDYVDSIAFGKLSHGIQSHRLQWYLIQEEFGAGKAVEWYKESLDPIWQTTDNKLMWDLIVDGSSNDEFDFTQPGKLQRYLDEKYEPPVTEENRIGDFLRAERANFEKKKRELNEQRAKHKKEGGDKPDPLVEENTNNIWKGWAQEKDQENWFPSILEEPNDLDRQFEKYTVDLSALQK